MKFVAFIGMVVCVQCYAMDYLTGPSSKLEKTVLVNDHSFRSAILRNDRAGINGYLYRSGIALPTNEIPKLFIAAACRSNSTVVQYLFKSFEFSVDYILESSPFAPYFEVTPLWATIMWGKNDSSKDREEQIKIVDFLLASKADPNKCCYHTSNMSLMVDCPKFMPLTIVIKKYAEALSGENKDCYDPQMNRALANHYGEIALQLLQAGANPDLPNSDTKSALDHAPDFKIRALLKRFSRQHGEGKGKGADA